MNQVAALLRDQPASVGCEENRFFLVARENHHFMGKGVRPELVHVPKTDGAIPTAGSHQRPQSRMRTCWPWTRPWTGWLRRIPSRPSWFELRYFAGLTGEQAAEALGISPTTADRHWAYARAWLRTEVRGS